MHSDSCRLTPVAANLARSAKVAWLGPHGPADARGNGVPSEPRLLRRSPPPGAFPSLNAMHPTTLNLAIRIDPSNPDHHLWNNHGVWWCHYTLHRGDLKRRVRLNLGVRDVASARELRDELFRSLGPAA